MTLLDPLLVERLGAGGLVPKGSTLSTFQAIDAAYSALGDMPATVALLETSFGVAARETVVLDSAGLLDVESGSIIVDTFESSASDTLERISLDLPEGSVVCISAASADRPVTVAHLVDGGPADGKIRLHADIDYVLTDIRTAILLQRVSNEWHEINLGARAGGAGARGVAESVDGVISPVWGPTGLNPTTILEIRRGSGDESPSITCFLPEMPAHSHALARVYDDITLMASRRDITVNASWGNAEGQGLVTLTNKTVGELLLEAGAEEVVSGAPFAAPTFITEIVSDSGTTFRTASTVSAAGSGTLTLSIPGSSIDGRRTIQSPAHRLGGVFMYFDCAAVGDTETLGRIESGERAIGLGYEANWFGTQAEYDAIVTKSPTTAYHIIPDETAEPVAADDPVLLAVPANATTVAQLVASGIDSDLVNPGDLIVVLTAVRRGSATANVSALAAVGAVALSATPLAKGAAFSFDVTNEIKVEAWTAVVNTRTPDSTFDLQINWASSNWTQGAAIYVVPNGSQAVGSGGQAAGSGNLSFAATADDGFAAEDIIFAIGAVDGTADVALPGAFSGAQVAISTSMRFRYGWRRGNVADAVAMTIAGSESRAGKSVVVR